MSPAESAITSPGTSSSMGSSRRRARGDGSSSVGSSVRSTVALVRTMALSANAARLDRNSCTNLSSALIVTITEITITALTSPVAYETTPSTARTPMNGLMKAWTSWTYHAGAFSCAISFRPISSRRRSAALFVRPWRDVSKRSSAATAVAPA